MQFTPARCVALQLSSPDSMHYFFLAPRNPLKYMQMCINDTHCKEETKTKAVHVKCLPTHYNTLQKMQCECVKGCAVMRMSPKCPCSHLYAQLPYVQKSISFFYHI